MIINDVKLDYSDVMLLPQCGDIDGPNSRSEVSLLNPDGEVPIIAANMDGVGTFEMALELSKFNMITALNKHYPADQLIEFYEKNVNISNYVIYSMGANDEDFMKFQYVYKHVTEMPMVCIDVANGYTNDVAEFIKYLKQRFTIKIIAGNVVTPSGVSHLASAGADVIKIGIGPGSVCTTRKLTGIGYPQFSAVLECADHAHNHLKNVQIIADGGITCAGDVAKALAAGADYVMIGGMFAGHEEGGGQLHVEQYSKKRSRYFYGMASKDAQNKHNGGVAEYRASEGKGVWIEDKGPVKNTVQEILGGLRSSCAYQGVKNLSDISKNPEFIRVSRQLNNVFGA